MCCSCGRRDCLNTRASGWAILVGTGRIEGHEFAPRQTPEYMQALVALLEGPPDADASALLHRAGGLVAEAASEACLYADPALVLVVGALVRSEAFCAGFHSHWAGARLRAMGGEMPQLVFDPAPRARGGGASGAERVPVFLGAQDCAFCRQPQGGRA